MSTPATLQYGSTTYTVEKREPTDRKIEMNRPVYYLTGPRGASYFTMRNVKDPSLLFLVNAKNFKSNVPFEWLREEPDGSLTILR